MSTQTLAAADAILKDLTPGPIVEQVNQKTYLLDQIERDSEHTNFTGRKFVQPVHTGRNRGRGARADGGTLPVAGTQTYQDAEFRVTYQYQGIELTDPAIEQSKSNEGAFIDLLKGEMKGAANDLRKDINRQAYGTGDGLLATVASEATATKTITLDSVQYIAVGDPVDVVKTADGTVGEGVQAVTVTKREGGSTKNIELSSTVTKVTTAYGVYIAGDRSMEINGLRNIIAKERTFGGINSATAGNEFWNASVVDVGTSSSETAVAGESSFEQLGDTVGFNGNGEVEVYLTTRGIRRRLADTYQSQKRFTNAEAVNVHGGYSAIMVSAGGSPVPVIADDDAPKGYAFGLNKGSFRWYELAAPGWLEQDNGGYFHLKDGSTAGTKVAVWQAWLKWYMNLGNLAPNRNGVLRFITDDNPA